MVKGASVLTGVGSLVREGAGRESGDGEEKSSGDLHIERMCYKRVTVV